MPVELRLSSAADGERVEPDEIGLPMVRIAITVEAFEAIARTPPLELGGRRALLQ